MKKIGLLFLVFCCFLAISCGSQENKRNTNEEENRLMDESAGVKGGIWFIPYNISASDYTVSYTDKEVKFGWTFTFHKNFYKKLIDKNEKYYYRFKVSDKVADIVDVQSTDFYEFLPFKEGGKLEYKVVVPFELDSDLTEDEIELINNDHDSYILYYDKFFEIQGSSAINIGSFDLTRFYE